MDKNIQILIIKTEIDPKRDLLDIDLVWSSLDSKDVDPNHLYSTACPNCDEDVIINVLVNFSNLTKKEEEFVEIEEDDHERWINENEELDFLAQENDIDIKTEEPLKEVSEKLYDIIEEFEEEERIELKVIEEERAPKWTANKEDEDLSFECDICREVIFFHLFFAALLHFV